MPINEPYYKLPFHHDDMTIFDSDNKVVQVQHMAELLGLTHDNRFVYTEDLKTISVHELVKTFNSRTEPVITTGKAGFQEEVTLTEADLDG